MTGSLIFHAKSSDISLLSRANVIRYFYTHAPTPTNTMLTAEVVICYVWLRSMSHHGTRWVQPCVDRFRGTTVGLLSIVVTLQSSQFSLIIISLRIV